MYTRFSSGSKDKEIRTPKECSRNAGEKGSVWVMNILNTKEAEIYPVDSADPLRFLSMEAVEIYSKYTFCSSL